MASVVKKWASGYVIHAPGRAAGTALCGMKVQADHAGTASLGAKQGVAIAHPGETVTCQRCEVATGRETKVREKGQDKAAARELARKDGSAWKASFLPFAPPRAKMAIAAEDAAKAAGLKGAAASNYELEFIAAAR